VEDVVAVRVTLDSGVHRYFLTWGRIQDRVDPGQIEAIVLENATRYSLGGVPVSATLCLLREASHEPYFFEGLWSFANDGVPFGRGYNRWRRRIDKEMRNGSHLYFLGRREEFADGLAGES
jgi:hypothetical protein